MVKVYQSIYLLLILNGQRYPGSCSFLHCIRSWIESRGRFSSQAQPTIHQSDIISVTNVCIYWMDSLHFTWKSVHIVTTEYQKPLKSLPVKGCQSSLESPTSSFLSQQKIIQNQRISRPSLIQRAKGDRRGDRAKG